MKSTVEQTGYTQTTLWTNPSPTSSFAGQTVTGSESVSNFELIRFDFYLAAGDTRLVSQFYDASGSTGMASWFDGSGIILRVANVGGTAIGFGDAYKFSAGSIAQNNAYLVPYKVVGIKLK